MILLPACWSKIDFISQQLFICKESMNNVEHKDAIAFEPISQMTIISNGNSMMLLLHNRTDWFSFMLFINCVVVLFSYATKNNSFNLTLMKILIFNKFVLIIILLFFYLALVQFHLVRHESSGD